MGRRARVVAGLVAVGVVILVVAVAVGASGRGADELPAGPVAAVQDDHLATVPPGLVEERLDLIAGTGVTATRFDILWSELAPERPADPADPDDPAYDWRRADAVVRGLAARGITPIVTLYSTPAWATDDAAPAPGPVNPAIPRPDEYAAVMTALARRYAGTHTPPGAQEPLPQVRRIELWNEPNLAGFLAPQVRDGRRVALDAYAAMVRAAYPAIKAAHPDAIVIIGAAGPRGATTRTGTGAMRWLTGLARRRVPLDAYSQHIYPSAAPDVPTMALPSWSSVGRFLEALDDFGRPGIPLYITEAGYTTSPTPHRDTVVTEAQQADYLERIFTLPQLQNDRIATVVWFNLQDNPAWPAGLLRADGTAKPSMRAFRGVVRRQGGAALG